MGFSLVSPIIFRRTLVTMRQPLFQTLFRLRKNSCSPSIRTFLAELETASNRGFRTNSRLLRSGEAASQRDLARRSAVALGGRLGGIAGGLNAEDGLVPDEIEEEDEEPT